MSPDHGYVRVEVFHEIENNLDIHFGLNPEFVGLINETQVRQFMGTLSERDLLRVVDYRLHAKGGYRPSAGNLPKILADGRSMYETVLRDGRLRLAVRVPEGVQDAADRIMNREGAAGRLLKAAWTHVYDLEPSDSMAYSSAVKAVEAAALPALGIAKSTATLSDVARAIERREATWRLPFLREHSEYPSKDVLLGMIKSLYRGQRDRHGSPAYSDVTHEEAETAVLLAVSLVGWFAGGLVQERDTEVFS